MFHINQHFQSLPGSYLFAEIASRVKAFEADNPNASIIRLGIGDVTRPLVPAVIEALHQGVADMGRQETFHGYGPDYGYDFLVNAIRQGDYASRGIDIAYDEVFISDGAKSDVSNLQELFHPETHVAVTDPVYPVYVDSNAMAGRAGDYVDGRWTNLVYLPCVEENGFVPDVPTRHVDVLYLCYPNNPTGTVLTKDQLQRYVDWAREKNALIVYDAAYRGYVNTPDIPLSIYEIPGAREVAIECNSFSKTAGFTGTRCAYTIIPHEVTGIGRGGEQVSLNSMWKRRMSTKFNGVSYPIQRGAAAVYTPEGQAQIKAVIQGYMGNAAIIRTGLQDLGFKVFGGVDAPYIWMKVPEGETSWGFFDRLLHTCAVVGTPGAGFGPSGEGYFRLTAFNTEENTRQAVERMQRLV